jgi:gliding motility-associated-like protein
VNSKPGTVSNSIWLQTSQLNRNNTALFWNPYALWSCGVKEYQLQLKDASGAFSTIKTLSSGILRADSLDIEKFGLDSICFRVFALKDSITNDTSMSNEVCLVPSSYVIIPNSFTPDDNGLNEVFKPVSGFIYRKSADPQKRFEFRVYNRWGQEVFFSDNADLGWNGFYENKLCSPGVYIFKIKALGYDGVPHILKGSVLLLR